MIDPSEHAGGIKKSLWAVRRKWLQGRGGWIETGGEGGAGGGGRVILKGNWVDGVNDIGKAFGVDVGL